MTPTTGWFMSYSQVSVNGERGFSTITMLMAILIGFLAITVLIRIVPVYIDDFTLGQVIGAIEERKGPRKLETERAVREYLRKRVEMEDIEGVNVADMKINYGNELLTIDYEYEVRTTFMGNIDAVIKFEQHHEMRAQ